MNGLLWVDCSSSCMLASQSSSAYACIFKTLWVPCISTRRSFFYLWGLYNGINFQKNIESDMELLLRLVIFQNKHDAIFSCSWRVVSHRHNHRFVLLHSCFGMTSVYSTIASTRCLCVTMIIRLP